MYRARTTNEFTKQARKFLSYSELEQLAKLSKRLENNATLGDIVGPYWLRESRIGGKRVYYITGKTVVIFIHLRTKQNQQRIIDEIRKRIDEWK